MLCTFSTQFETKLQNCLLIVLNFAVRGAGIDQKTLGLVLSTLYTTVYWFLVTGTEVFDIICSTIYFLNLFFNIYISIFRYLTQCVMLHLGIRYCYSVPFGACFCILIHIPLFIKIHFV